MTSLSTRVLHIALVVAALAVLTGYIFLSQPTSQALGSVYDATRIDVATTTAATSITTSARIMATTTSLTGTSYTRSYAVICNPNANPVWINMDADKAANLTSGNVTTVIAAAAGYNACFEITDRNLYVGSVTASSTNQTATVITVKQYVQ